ncbi:MAG: hypothetical protein ACXVPN_03915 [Bacteroidia bacterium]
MNEVEILEDLLKAAKKISYSNEEEFNVIKQRAEMYVRKFFGDDSHYISDLRGISYSPSFFVSGSDTNWKYYFEKGLKEFQDVISVMIEDKRLSSNYENKKTDEFIKSETPVQSDKKTLKEIRVLIASPGDVKVERELLLDKLETFFRREHYEDRCGARIIVEGWESVASQTGYAQDIINNDLVKKANIILTVFRHKLGSPTIDLASGKDRSPSGTAEELLYAIRNKLIKNPPLGMAYFYTNAPVLSLDSVDFEKTKKDWDRLKEFKDTIKNEILYKTYNLEEEILQITAKDLCDNIIKYFK